MSAEQEEWAAFQVLAIAGRLEHLLRLFPLVQGNSQLRNDVGTLCALSRMLVP